MVSNGCGNPNSVAVNMHLYAKCGFGGWHVFVLFLSQRIDSADGLGIGVKIKLRNFLKNMGKYLCISLIICNFVPFFM